MGAYYNGCVKQGRAKSFKRYDSWSLQSGAKLMEHGYLENDYVNAVLNTIVADKPFKLSWLCDYTDNEELTWGTSKEVNFDVTDVLCGQFVPCVYVNLDKKEYINLNEVIEHSSFKYTNSDWLIHPLVLLTNSEEESMGGGDYHKSCSWRSSWKGDTLKKMMKLDIPMDFKNISYTCTLKENEED